MPLFALTPAVASLAIAPAADSAETAIAPRGFGESRHIAHIHYNVALDERVATLVDPVNRSDVGSSQAVWISDNSLPCANYGQTSGRIAVMDDAACGPVCFSSACASPFTLGVIFLDWGDAPYDTVVDCVGLSWSSMTLDVDGDGDGIGDGVPGFAARWFWIDRNNGYGSSPVLNPTFELILTDLPGALPGMGPNEFATYTATVDLAPNSSAGGGFELGDTDSVDSSDSGNFMPGSGVDLDSDGLTDFGYGLEYIQPGTADLDGDGHIDGTYDDAGDTGWLVASPPGTVVQTDGTWDIIPDAPPAGQGAEDAFDYYNDCNGYEPLRYYGTYNFTGFSCDANGDGVTDDYIPYAQLYMNLYGPGNTSGCAADIYPDITPDGNLDFFDVMHFIGWYNAGDPRADIAPPFGELNFFDMTAYINSFIVGCP